MGLLQRLLGRRDTPDSVPDPAPENEAETTSDEAESTSRVSSGALADAAPADDSTNSHTADDTAEESSSSAEDTSDDDDKVTDDNDVATTDADGESSSAETAAEPETAPETETESKSYEESTPSDSTEESSVPSMTVVKDTETDSNSTEGDEAEPTESSAKLVAVSGPAQVDDEASASSGDESSSTSAQAGFIPERPKRELLTLDKPPAPTDIPTQRSNQAAESDTSKTRPPRDQDLALDTEGSPRPALRSAGVAVPKMQQIARKGDVRLWAFPVKANEALGWWLEIRQVHDRTGWLPILIGHPAEWRDGGEEIIHEGDDELGRSLQIDPVEMLSQKGSEAGEPPRGVPILPRRGDSDFATPRSDGLLGLVRAEHGWQIPSLLPWKGSTNWELYGAEHTAILRYWASKYDVELMAMTYDVLELYVANPPEPNDAVKAAEEIYAYCPDLLDSGVPTLDDLAEHMAQSKAWYFRWT